MHFERERLGPDERDGFFPDNDHEMRLPEAREDDNQLLGQGFSGDRMVHLRNNIYCTRSVLKEIDVHSRSGTGVARLLMVGIFDPQGVSNCTLTGRKGINQGAVNQNQSIKPLHNIARETIVEFAKNYAVNKGWSSQSEKAYRQAMTRKLGEIKRDHNNV